MGSDDQSRPGGGGDGQAVTPGWGARRRLPARRGPRPETDTGAPAHNLGPVRALGLTAIEKSPPPRPKREVRPRSRSPPTSPATAAARPDRPRPRPETGRPTPTVHPDCPQPGRSSRLGPDSYQKITTSTPKARSASKMPPPGRPAARPPTAHRPPPGRPPARPPPPPGPTAVPAPPPPPPWARPAGPNRPGLRPRPPGAAQSSKPSPSTAARNWAGAR